jgi:hypothetical protein
MREREITGKYAACSDVRSVKERRRLLFGMHRPHKGRRGIGVWIFLVVVGMQAEDLSRFIGAVA